MNHFINIIVLFLKDILLYGVVGLGGFILWSWATWKICEKFVSQIPYKPLRILSGVIVAVLLLFVLFVLQTGIYKSCNYSPPSHDYYG